MVRPPAGRKCLFAPFLAAVLLTPAWAQQAKVTGLAGVVSKRAGSATKWQPCKLNMPLAAGDRVRTAGRSRCQITFADGSVVRVGERSDITIRGARSMTVARGRMYGRFAKGATATVGGRSAVAAVKGTRLEFVMTDDGEETVRCHEGQVYVAQAGLLTKTGTADTGTTTALTDDALTEPDGYWNGATLRILAGTNEGQERNVVNFDAATDTVTVDVAFPQAIDNTSQYELTLPTAEGAVTLGPGEESSVEPGGSPSEPSPTPPEEFAGGEEFPGFQGVIPGVWVPTFVGSPAHLQFREDNVNVDGGIEEVMGGPTGASLDVIVRSTEPPRSAGPSSAGSAASAALIPPVWASPVTTPVATWGAAAPSPFGAILAAPQESVAPPESRGAGGLLGERMGVELFAFGSNRNALGSIRIRPTGVLDKVYFELGGTTRQLFDGQSVLDLTSAYITARGKGLGDLRVGRQRFLMGPVNNSNVGTLLDFDVADAIAWSPDTDDRVQLDFAYIWDLDPLADDFMGTGWFGRASFLTNEGIFSLNGLYSDSNRPGPGSTTVNGDMGYSLDFAVPLDRNKVDFYGEVGQDAWDRDLYTVGVYFPCLYFSSELDLFTEFAHRERDPDLWSMRAYKTLDDNWQAILALQLPEGDNLDYGLGFSYKFEFK